MQYVEAFVKRAFNGSWNSHTVIVSSDLDRYFKDREHY